MADSLRAGRVRKLLSDLMPRSAEERKRERREMSGTETDYAPGKEQKMAALPADFLVEGMHEPDAAQPAATPPKKPKKPKKADDEADEPADVNAGY